MKPEKVNGILKYASVDDFHDQPGGTCYVNREII